MALRDVRDFVRKHARQLGLALCGQDEPGMHADEPAGQRERVDLRVAYQEEFEILTRVRALRGEAVAERIDVVGSLRIVVEAAVRADLAHDVLTELALLDRGESGLRHVTEVRQSLGQDARNGEQQQQQKYA